MFSIEEAVRDYLRAQPSLLALVDGNASQINMEVPSTALSSYKCVTFYVAGGSVDDYVPLDSAIVTFHCYAPNRKDAEKLAVTTASLMRNISNKNEPLRSCSVESRPAWLPTSDGLKRYVVTTRVTALFSPDAG